MINGTQFITALGAEGEIDSSPIINLFSSIDAAVERAISIAHQADIIAALSTEALRGTVRHLHPSNYFLHRFPRKYFR
jgi:histidine ammonia-lyase